MSQPIWRSAAKAVRSVWRVPWWGWVVSGLLLFGLGLRLLDLTDPPLDIHAWRQLRSASIARGVYYQHAPWADPELRLKAIELGHFGPLEPEIAEHLVGYTYLILGREELWIARLYSIVAWMIGGVGLFALARRLTSPGAGVFSLGFYLLLPFGVIGSRAFLPDVYMVMWTMLAAWAFHRWTDEHRWPQAVVAGLLAGMAILTKVFAFFPLAAVAFALLASTRGLRRSLADPQAWVCAALAGIIPSWYYFWGLPGAASTYVSGWVLGFSNLLLSPTFYARWAAMVRNVTGVPFALAGLLGVTLVSRRGRAALLGLWAGYALIGLSVPSLIISHSYYSLVLVPVVALSLSPLAEVVFARLAAQPAIWKAAAGIVAVAGLLYPAWLVRAALFAEDYRREPIIWQRVGQSLPADGPIIGLTHDYNARLRYYGWIAVAQWPHASDYQMNVLAGGNYDPNDPAIREEFERRTDGYDYFLVTLFGELDAQPVLRDLLYDRYPYREGDGYILFDLRRSLEPSEGSSPRGLDTRLATRAA